MKKKKPHVHEKGWQVYSRIPYSGAFVFRPNKVAVHYQRKAKIKAGDLLTLAVYGTLDSLAKRGGFICRLSQRVRKEHPVHKGYFMDVYILSKYGTELLKRKRNATEKENRNNQHKA